MSDEKKSEASINETLAVNRALPVVEATTIPPPAPGFRATTIEVRRRQLRRISGGLQAEINEALREYAARGTAIVKTLGEKAPSAESASSLLHRLNELQNSLTAAELLRDYLAELAEIALSDAVELLEKAKKRIVLESEEDATLNLHHKKLLTLFEARSALISEGRARASEERKNQADDTPTDL